MPERTLRVVSMLGAFLCGLVLVFGAVLFVTARSSSIGPALAAVGGPFHLVDRDGKAVSDEDIKAVRSWCSSASPTARTEGGDYTKDHTAVVYLMDKNGRFVAPFNMKRTAEAEVADLRGYL